MLVLSRKQDQGVMLDDRIEIQILSVRGSRVKLGIRAPSEVRIVRRESGFPTGCLGDNGPSAPQHPLPQ
jgi:carbon storage regulator